jgi:hypothetical protein
MLTKHMSLCVSTDSKNMAVCICQLLGDGMFGWECEYSRMCTFINNQPPIKSGTNTTSLEHVPQRTPVRFSPLFRPWTNEL